MKKYFTYLTVLLLAFTSFSGSLLGMEKKSQKPAFRVTDEIFDIKDGENKYDRKSLKILNC